MASGVKVDTKPQGKLPTRVELHCQPITSRPHRSTRRVTPHDRIFRRRRPL